MIPRTPCGACTPGGGTTTPGGGTTTPGGGTTATGGTGAAFPPIVSPFCGPVFLEGGPVAPLVVLGL